MGIRNDKEWNGLYDAKLPFRNSWSPQPPSEPSFPMQQLIGFDQQHNTKYALKSDSEFTDKDLRYLIKNNTATAKELNEYFWKEISTNSNATCVLFAYLEKAKDVTVCTHIYYFPYITDADHLMDI